MKITGTITDEVIAAGFVADWVKPGNTLQFDLDGLTVSSAKIIAQVLVDMGLSSVVLTSTETVRVEF